MRRHLLACGCLLAGICAYPAMADIDPSEYELKTSVRSERERQRLAAGFARDRQQEAALQRQEEDRAAQKVLAEKAAWDALPYPVRLTRTRCTTCHEAGNYVSQRHNRLGWELIILRMQYLNEAPLAEGERAVIATHLSESYPVSGSDALLETMQQLAMLLSPLWLWLAWKLLRTRWGRLRLAPGRGA